MSSTLDLDTELSPTVADLIDRLDGIAPRRILLRPTPGTATEADLQRVLQRGRQLCELVDGTLVEKCMGARVANLAAWIIRLLGYFTDPQNLGELFGSDGPFRLLGGLVRLPDVTFVRREKLPGGQVPAQAILELAPDLAIEVLSEGNPAGEMQRKRREYFLAGTTLVWEVDPRRRVLTVYTAPEEGQVRTVADMLDGGTVLPGLQLPVVRIFERLRPVETPPTRRSRKKPTA